MGYARMRTRNESGSPISSQVRSWEWYRVTSTVQGKRNDVTNTYSTPSWATSETMTDEVTPGFRVRQCQGGIFNSPMNRVVQTVTGPHPERFDVVRYTPNSNGIKLGFEYHGEYAMTSTQLGAHLGAPSSYSTQLDTAMQKAVTSAHANQKINDAMILATAAEAQKSVASVAAIMKRVIRVARAVKKFDAQYLRKQLSFEELQNRWMEARYALRPLYYDARQITEALNNSRVVEKQRQTSRAFGSAAGGASDTITMGGIGDNYRDINRTVTVFADVRAGVLSEIRLSEVSIWGADLGAETLWELAPLSFIVDWFWNVGDVISSLTPKLGVRELASWVVVTETKTQINEVTAVRYWDAGAYAHEEFTWGGRKQTDTITKTRVVNPTLTFVPQFDLNLDVSKIIDLGIIGKRI